MVSSSENPQEVGDRTEIVFTYDVEFQVSSVAMLTSDEDASQSCQYSSILIAFVIFRSRRRVM